jgi:hypothetical protein
VADGKKQSFTSANMGLRAVLAALLFLAAAATSSEAARTPARGLLQQTADCSRIAHW